MPNVFAGFVDGGLQLFVRYILDAVGQHVKVIQVLANGARALLADRGFLHDSGGLDIEALVFLQTATEQRFYRQALVGGKVFDSVEHDNLKGYFLIVE